MNKKKKGKNEWPKDKRGAFGNFRPGSFGKRNDEKPVFAQDFVRASSSQFTLAGQVNNNSGQGTTNAIYFAYSN
jgi:hypothetical protein